MKRLHFHALAAAVALLGLVNSAPIVRATECSAEESLNNPAFSSVQLHQRREGVIVPLSPRTADVTMKSIKLQATPDFFACWVRNLTVAVKAEFELVMSNTTWAARTPVAFPITTHALYGDHNQLKDIRITVNGAPVDYRAALDYELWEIDEQGVSYKGRLVNHQVHPLLANAANLHSMAPQLIERGHDLILFWNMPNASLTATTRVGVEYTYSSNAFSSCCREVVACTSSAEPLFFYFDLSNAAYWPGEKDVELVFAGSPRALWSGIPKTGLETGLETVSTYPDIVLAGTGQGFADMSISLQPAVFSCHPRTWREHPSPVQTFTLRWREALAALGIDSVVIDRIEGVGGINIHADLPIRLSRENPQATFQAAHELPTMPLAYIDVFGTGFRDGQADPRFGSWLRIPLAGPTIMGHDLAVKRVQVERETTQRYRVTADVFNAGYFTEPLTMTLNVNQRFAAAERFRCEIAPGETKTLTMGVDGDWPLPATFEVEIEPTPGETRRRNNAMTVTHPAGLWPRPARYTLRPDQSLVTLITPDGQRQESALHGGITLLLGDPDVPVIALEGMVGLSVQGAVLYAPDIVSLSATSARPPRGLYMYKDPAMPSIGSYNRLTGEINFALYLTTRQGDMPAQQPMIFSGRLTPLGLFIRGHSSESAEPARMFMKIVAQEAAAPTKPEFWFSTTRGFHPGRLPLDSDGVAPQISDGDLLSSRGYVVASNQELTAHLGIMPMVPDLGLSAVTPGPRGEIWFSFDKGVAPQWSETLGRYLHHGDLLANTGRVVQTNQQLTARFRPRLSDAAYWRDLGLDALALPAGGGAIYFSTTESFFSTALNRYVGHGDLLSNRGVIVRRNRELLSEFSPLEDLADFGLDAVFVRPNGEIWFSVATGFTDEFLGPISDGDVLSDRGYVVARNRQLLAGFAPEGEEDDFGLDALSVAFVDVQRYDYFPAGFGGDADGDGRINLRDFAILAEQWPEHYDIIDLVNLAQGWLE